MSEQAPDAQTERLAEQIMACVPINPMARQGGFEQSRSDIAALPSTATAELRQILPESFYGDRPLADRLRYMNAASAGLIKLSGDAVRDLTYIQDALEKMASCQSSCQNGNMDTPTPPSVTGRTGCQTKFFIGQAVCFHRSRGQSRGPSIVLAKVESIEIPKTEGETLYTLSGGWMNSFKESALEAYHRSGAQCPQRVIASLRERVRGLEETLRAAAGVERYEDIAASDLMDFSKVFNRLERAEMESKAIATILDAADVAVGDEHRVYPLTERVEMLAKAKDYFVRETDKSRARIRELEEAISDVVKLCKEPPPSVTGRTDGERLGWLEKHGACVNRLGVSQTDPREYWHLYFTPKGSYSAKHFGQFPNTLRSVIDAAISATEQKKGRE